MMNFHLLFFKILFLFIHDRERERERLRKRERERGRSRLHAGSWTWDSIPGLQDHTLSPKQVLKPLGHRGCPQ